MLLYYTKPYRRGTGMIMMVVLPRGAIGNIINFKYRLKADCHQVLERKPSGIKRREKEMSIRFKCSQELADGDRWRTVVDTPSQVAELVKIWAEEAMKDDVGETCGIETIEMSDEEFEAMPDL